MFRGQRHGRAIEPNPLHLDGPPAFRKNGRPARAFVQGDAGEAEQDAGQKPADIGKEGTGARLFGEPVGAILKGL